MNFAKLKIWRKLYLPQLISSAFASIIHNLPPSILRGMFLGCEEDSLAILLESYEFHMTAAKHGLALMAKEKEKESPLGTTIINPPKKGQVRMIGIAQCRMFVSVWYTKLYFFIIVIIFFFFRDCCFIFTVLPLSYFQFPILRIFINYSIQFHIRCSYDLKTLPLCIKYITLVIV